MRVLWVSGLPMAWAFFAASCEPSRSFHTRCPLPEKGWHEAAPVELFFAVEDTTFPHRLSLLLESTRHYPFYNLYLTGTLQEAADCKVLLVQEQEHTLYEPTSGHPLGRAAGDKVRHEVIFEEKYTFPRRGVYILSLQHRMRKEVLPGILSVGLRGYIHGRIRGAEAEKWEKEK